MTTNDLLEWARRLTGRDQLSRRLPGIKGRVHICDTMLIDSSEEGVRAYLRNGKSAMDNIEDALRLAGLSFGDIASCLDFGCGYGRVHRWLRQEIRRRRLTACDIDNEAVLFCSREFGSRRLLSFPDIEQVRFRTYDLIWAGSVLTHVEDDTCDRLLEALGKNLRPGGLLVFTTHGEFSYSNLENLYEGFFADDAETVQRELTERGVAYRPYERSYGGYNSGEYGFSWHTMDFLSEKMDRLFSDRLRLLRFAPQGWDGHQDVYSYQRRRELPAGG